MISIVKGALIPKLLCHNGETYPTVNVTAGTKITETDTGKVSIFDGATWWPIGAVPVSITGSLAKSGKKTDADATDRTIDTTSVGGFSRIILDCQDCTSEMTFTIDEAISGAQNPIYIASGGGIDANISGKVLHYSGSGTFRYTLLK